MNERLLTYSQLLHMVDALTLSTESIDKIAEFTVDPLQTLLGCHLVSVFIRHEGVYRLVAESRLAQPVPVQSVEVPLSEFGADAPDAYTDVTALPEDSELIAYCRTRGIGAMAIMPIEVDNEIQGVALICRDTPGELTGEQLVTSHDVVAQLGMALQHIRLEERLAEETQTLRILIDSLPDYVFIKDREGRYVVSNRAHAESGGMEPDDLVGLLSSEVYPGETGQIYHEQDMFLMETNKPILNTEQLLIDADNIQRETLVSRIPLHNERDEVIGMVGIVRDVTELRQAEADRREAEGLRIALDKEKELSELKMRFVLTVSHEFRTPITIIQSSAQLLSNHYDRLTKERHNQLSERVVEQTRFMTQLLDDTLIAGQAQINQVSYNPQPTDLVQICTTVMDQVKSVDKIPHDFQFINNIEDPESYLLDPRLMHEIITNLLSNAVKYTDANKAISIIIDILHDDNSKRFLRLVVEDEGRGIPPVELPKIFDPFHRGDNVGRIPGTGLGLAIVREYVTLHSGTVSCESEEGTGTRFTIDIPVAKK